MENPKGDEMSNDMDDRRSQYSQYVIINLKHFLYRLSRRSQKSTATTTLIITHLAKQLDEERIARKKLEEELQSIKQLSMQLLNNS